MDLPHVIRSFARQFRQHGLRGLLRALADRLYIRWFEWRLGIRSEIVISLEELGIKGPGCHYYSPTDYRSFLKVLDALDIHPGEDVFLDFGSGLGRAVILAGTRSFRKIIGVEIAPQLNEVARQNIRSALPRLKCRDIELITSDATVFNVPGDVTVIYLFNPFDGEVLGRVLANIRKSLAQEARRLRIVCKVPERSTFEEEIRRQSWLVLDREFTSGTDSRYLFFTAQNR